MKQSNQRSASTEKESAPYPIYPDIDANIPEGNLSEGELIQENDTLNPDPDSLDRG